MASIADEIGNASTKAVDMMVDFWGTEFRSFSKIGILSSIFVKQQVGDTVPVGWLARNESPIGITIGKLG